MAAVAAVGANALVLGPLLSDVAAGLGAKPVELTRAPAAYNGATALSALLFGTRIDRIGNRRAVLLGLALLALAAGLSAAARSVAGMACAQALAGVAAGMILPAGYALATRLARPGREAAALGRVLIGWSLAIGLCVPAAAALAAQLGWRAAFAVLAVAATALLVLSAALLPAAPPVAAARPALRLVLTDRRVLSLFATCLAYMAAFYGVYAFLSDEARAIQHISAARAGILVLMYGAGFTAAGFADPWLDRAGPARVFPASLLCLAAIYATMPIALSAWPSILAVSFAWGLVNHVSLNLLVLLLTQTRPADRGAVLGLNSAVTYAGAMLGVLAAGPIMAGHGFPTLAHAAAALMLIAGLARLV